MITQTECEKQVRETERQQQKMNHIAIINKRPYNYTGRKWLGSFQRINEHKPSFLSVLIILVEFLRFYLCYALGFLFCLNSGVLSLSSTLCLVRNSSVPLLITIESTLMRSYHCYLYANQIYIHVFT